MKNFLKTITSKLFLKYLALYIAIVVGVVLAGGIYLILGAWLISGIFTTTFTALQFAQANALVWLANGVRKLWKETKIEK